MFGRGGVKFEAMKPNKASSSKSDIQTKIEVLALHRYWIWANNMREHFYHALVQPEWLERTKKNGALSSEDLARAFFCDDPGVFMSYWYGGLFVVIEGWKELHLSDPVIDSLIADPKVDLLKRYRNGAFHFQKNYFDQRFQGFIEEKEAAKWARELNSEFGRYFLGAFGVQNSNKTSDS